MKRLLFFLILIFSFAAFAFAQQRPLLTEDVDTTPEGAVRVSAGVDFLQNVKYPLSGLKGDQTSVGDIRISVGFSKNVEFQIEGTVQNYVAINSATDPSPIPLDINGNSTNDSGDFTLSTKIKLRNETRILPALGFKFGFQLPNTNQARGIGTNQINVFGKVLVQKKFGSRNKNNTARVNMFGNVGLGIMTSPLERFSQNDLIALRSGGNLSRQRPHQSRQRSQRSRQHQKRRRAARNGKRRTISRRHTDQSVGTQIRHGGDFRSDQIQPAHGHHVRRNLRITEHLYSGSINSNQFQTIYQMIDRRMSFAEIGRSSNRFGDELFCNSDRFF